MLPALLVALVLAAPAGASASEVIVGGWVVHASSRARLPGARVSLHCGSKFRLTTQWTDMDGAFVFRGVPAGHCTLHAALGTDMPVVKLVLRADERRLIDVPLDPESQRGVYWTLQAWAQRGAHITRVPLVVPPGAEVVFGGFVVHLRSRERLAGAVVLLRCGGSVREEHADADGAFAFREVQPGECTLQVLWGGANETIALVFGAGERRVIDVAVDPERALSISPAMREEMLREGDTVKIRPRSKRPR